jgi:hypothetical protein
MTTRWQQRTPDPFRTELEQHPSRILQAAVGDPVQSGLLLAVVEGQPDRDQGCPAQWRAVAGAFAGQPGRAVAFLFACSRVAEARRRVGVPPLAWWAAWEQAIAGVPPATIRRLCLALWTLGHAVRWLANDHAARGLARAAIWGVTTVADATTAEALAAAARAATRGHCRPNLRVALRALACLEAWTTLYRLAWELPRQGARNAASRILTQEAARRGLDTETLKDRLVSTAGLSVSGERSWAVGNYAADLRLSSDGRAVLSFRNTTTGRPVRRLPEKVGTGRATALAARHAVAQEIRGTLRVEMGRLEAAMIAGRAWAAADWHTAFAGHPLLGHLAQRLVWAITAGGETILARPTPAGWITALDAPVAVPDTALIRLTHPIALSEEARLAWREHLRRHAITQPFAQIDREVYRVTPLAGKPACGTLAGQTLTFTERVRMALTRYGWRGIGYQREACFGFRDFRACGIRITVELVAPLRPGVADVVLAAVRAEQFPPTVRWPGQALTPVADLATVPPALLSEAVREIAEALPKSARSALRPAQAG